MKKYVKAEIEEEIRDFLEFNEKEYTTCTILFNTKKIKVVLRRNFIAQMPTLKKRESSLIDNLRAQFKVQNKRSE